MRSTSRRPYLTGKPLFISALLVITLTFSTVYITGINFNRSIENNLNISQSLIDLNTRVISIERKFDHASVFFIDSMVFKQHYYYPRDHLKRIFLEDIPLDSSRLYLKNIDYVLRNKLIGHNHQSLDSFNEELQILEYDQIIYQVDLERKKIISFGELHNAYISPLSDFYCATFEGNDSVVFKINPETLEINDWLTLYPNFPELGIYETHQFWELGSIWEISNNKLLMSFVECPGDCFNYRYLTYNLITNEYSVVKWYDSLRRKEIQFNEEKTGQSNSGYARIDFLIKTFDENYFSYGFIGNGNEIILHKEDFVFDENLNIITPALKKTSYSKNYNYFKGEKVSVMKAVELDNNKTVFVPYRYTLPLERSFYKIYNDQEILNEDVKQFDEYELSILRNFIFARHNYRFNTEFYQAYFNLFEFYNNEKMRSSRTKDVNRLLTEADVKNLEVINKSLKKYK